MDYSNVEEQWAYFDKDRPLQDKYNKHHYYSELPVSPYIGIGNVIVLNLCSQITSLVFDFNLNEDFTIAIDAATSSSVCLFYALEGESSVFMSDDGLNRPITLEKVIVAKSGFQNAIQLMVKKQKNLRLNAIIIDLAYFNELQSLFQFTDANTEELFSNLIRQSVFYHEGDYDFQISEEIKLEKQLKFKNAAAKKLFFIGQQYVILSYIWEHLSIPKSKAMPLRKTEMKQISEMGNRIEQQPHLQYRVVGICKELGLSPAKLQIGFKFLFNHTVSDYVRAMRLKKAENLLRTTDLTISEIVYSVGLTSRSYFCKIFKQEFSANPKSYRKKHRVTSHELH